MKGLRIRLPRNECTKLVRGQIPQCVHRDRTSVDRRPCLRECACEVTEQTERVEAHPEQLYDSGGISTASSGLKFNSCILKNALRLCHERLSTVRGVGGQDGGLVRW